MEAYAVSRAVNSVKNDKEEWHRADCGLIPTRREPGGLYSDPLEPPSLSPARRWPSPFLRGDRVSFPALRLHLRVKNF
jgi:hypothetical protein